MRALADEEEVLREVEAVVVVVVALAAVEVVDGVVAVVASVDVTAAVVAVEAVDWRAMPSPMALATPMLREATRARPLAAGCGRFLFMGRTYGSAVSGWFAHGEKEV